MPTLEFAVILLCIEYSKMFGDVPIHKTVEGGFKTAAACFKLELYQ